MRSTRKLPKAVRARVEASEVGTAAAEVVAEARQEEVDDLTVKVQALRQKQDAKSLVEFDRLRHPTSGQSLTLEELLGKDNGAYSQDIAELAVRLTSSCLSGGKPRAPFAPSSPCCTRTVSKAGTTASPRRSGSASGAATSSPAATTSPPPPLGPPCAPTCPTPPTTSSTSSWPCTAASFPTAASSTWCVLQPLKPLRSTCPPICAAVFSQPPKFMICPSGVAESEAKLIDESALH